MNIKKYIVDLQKDEKNSHGYRAEASISMLDHVDMIIDGFKEVNKANKGQLLMAVFGLLQGFFVGIDALYDLSIGLTQYKYPININNNKVLHELKYIRNDIVGHPTHRIYPNGGIGFSVIDNINGKKMEYKTHIYEKKELKTATRTIYYDELIEQYEKEKVSILNEIENYLLHSKTKTNLPELLTSLYETLNFDLLKQIKEDFITIYKIKSPSHRFLWRVSLLEKLLLWEERDKDLSGVVTYMTKLQIAKLYDIALDMEERVQIDLYTPLPKLINSFYKFIRKDEERLIHYLQNLNDSGHPFYEEDLKTLLNENPPEDVYKLLNFLAKQTDSDKSHLIGSVLRNYRKKNE